MPEFLMDIEKIRARAREHIERGPITDAYGADRERVIQVLNEVLATEIAFGQGSFPGEVGDGEPVKVRVSKV